MPKQVVVAVLIDKFFQVHPAMALHDPAFQITIKNRSWRCYDFVLPAWMLYKQKRKYYHTSKTNDFTKLSFSSICFILVLQMYGIDRMSDLSRDLVFVSSLDSDSWYCSLFSCVYRVFCCRHHTHHHYTC